MKKNIITSIMVALLLLGITATCLADTGSFDNSITATRATAKFYHFISTGEGQVIEVEQCVTERHLATADVYTVTHGTNVVGGSTTVTSVRNAGVGCKYLWIDWTRGYVDHAFNASSGKEYVE